MPVRIVDRVARLGRIDTNLDGASENAQGASIAPAGRVGNIATQLQGGAAQFNGVFVSAPNRTGLITTGMDGVVGSWQGTAFVPGSSGPSVDVTTFSVEGTGTQAASFGHTFAPGQVPANTSVVITDAANNVLASSQAEKRAVHQDGSLRHAVLHGLLLGKQTYKIRTGTPPVGVNKDVAALLAAVAGDIARVDFSAGVVSGSCILRDLLSSTTNRTPDGLVIRATGPTCLHVTVAQTFATHLQVRFDVRWYGGTVIWCDFIFELGIRTLAGQGSKAYTATCTLNGTSLGATVLAPHYNGTRWHKPAWTSGGTHYVRHNAQYLIDSKAFANLDTSQAPSASYLSSLPTSVAPMNIGQYSADPDGTGAQDALGIHTRWEAAHLTSGCDVRSFRGVLANTDGAGAYPYTFIDHLTGYSIRMSDAGRTNYSVTEDSGFPTGYASGQGPYPASAVQSHLASIAYMAYLLTGQENYLRQLSDIGCYCVMWNSVDRNQTQGGQTVRRSYDGSMRGHGWWIRTVAQAAYVLPDAHPNKTFLVNAINGQAVYDTARFGPSGDLKNVLGADPRNLEGNTQYRVFMHMFLMQAMGYAWDLGFTGFLEPARYFGKFVAGLFGSTGEFPHEFGPAYTHQIGPTDTTFYSSFASIIPNWAGKSAPVTADPCSAAMLTATGLARNVETGTPNTPDSYYANARPAVAYLEALRIPGGKNCWYRHAASNPSGWNDTPQFNILPRAPSRPTWWKNLALNTWYSIPNTALSSAAPSPTPPGNSGPVAKCDAWCGMALRTLDSVILHAADGGHTDYAGNEVNWLSLNTETPLWVQAVSPTPSGQVIANAAYFGNGYPNSRHSYCNEHFIDGRDVLLQHGAAYTYQNATSFDDVAAYSYGLNAWLPDGTYPDAVGCGTSKPIAVHLMSESIYYGRSTNPNIIARYKPSNGSVLVIGTAASDDANIYKSACVDPIRHRMLISTGYNGTEGWGWINLDTAVKTNTPTLNSLGNSGSIEWDTYGNRYLFCPSTGTALYAIDPVSFALTPITLAGTQPPATGPNGGLYSKMRWVPELLGVTVQTQYAQNVRFIKLYTGAPAVPVGNALRFPSNVSGADKVAPFAVLQYNNPHTNGLPIWGPGGQGVTVFRRYRPLQQTGYYAAFWYSDAGVFENNFPPRGFWGFHPYPNSQDNQGTAHSWEIAIDQGDYRVNGNGAQIAVTKGQWYTQALRVVRNSANSKTLTFYTNLPSTAPADVITITITTSNYGETAQANPTLTIGDSPWYAEYQHERASGDIAEQMIIAKAMSEADIVAQSQNLKALVTADAAANIWWGKKSYATVNDLLCDYGTGRTFGRVDASNLLTVVPAT